MAKTRVSVDTIEAFRPSGVTTKFIAARANPGWSFVLKLPVSDEWADVVISNGVMNLFPDKSAGLREMARVLKPGGRLQIEDILVERAVPEGAKKNIDLWKG